MNHCLPSAVISDDAVRVRFQDSAPTRAVDVKCTVDLTDFGDVIGVEVLGWRQQLSGGHLVGPPSCGHIRWSYDEEVDAFYVHLADGRGQVQRSAVGRVSLDANQQVVGLDVPVGSANRHQ